MAKKKLSKKDKESTASQDHVHSDACVEGYSSKKDQRSCIRKARKDWQEMVKRVYPPYIEWRENRWDWDETYKVPEETFILKIPLHKALALDAMMTSYAAIELKKSLDDINTGRLFNCFDRSKFLEYVIGRGAIQFSWSERTREDEDMKQQAEQRNEIRKELRFLFSNRDSALKEMIEDYMDDDEEDDE